MNRPEDRLRGEFDALVWAREFCAIYKNGVPAPDQGTMIGWFANAIMAGYDRARKEETTPAHWFKSDGHVVYHHSHHGQKYVYAMAYGAGQADELAKLLNQSRGINR